MAGVKGKHRKQVFGLDIGTRSIVGTIGYFEDGKFHVLAQQVHEHDTRAMLDGQIHDIGKVAEGIVQVRRALEKQLGKKMREVCVAAAGRVLRTVTERIEMRFEQERDITQEDIYELSMQGIQNAYEELYRDVGTDARFYCVGHTVMHYYVNGYQINSPKGHKAGELSADMIATFLPDEVVDGLYKAVEQADLKVANLTLEPIAAIHVAIPEKFRLLNLALVDVGAGTSDICITKEGAVTAYGMLPVAGDRLTDCIAQHYLVDFETAEKIKRQIKDTKEIAFDDIMGLRRCVSQEEIREVLESTIGDMTGQVAQTILDLNGGKPVSAVFIVGGGGMVPGYSEALAKRLGLPVERVAVRGQDVMQEIVFENENAIRDSLMVTPIGICYSYFEPNNNFIFLDFNGSSIKLYDNGKLTVSDMVMSTKYANEDLFPKRGKSLQYTVNGHSSQLRGKVGEASEILVNGVQADLYTPIRNGDQIQIKASGKGENASMLVKQLPEMRKDLKLRLQDREVSFPKRVLVNGEEKGREYSLCDGDRVEIFDWYPVESLAKVLDIPEGTPIYLNGLEVASDQAQARVQDGDSLDWEEDDEEQEEPEEEQQEEQVEEQEVNGKVEVNDIPVVGMKSIPLNGLGGFKKKWDAFDPAEVSAAPAAPAAKPLPASVPLSGPGATSLTGTANGRQILMQGKQGYVYVDIFDYIDFDIKQRPQGKSIVTLLNGRNAEYMEPLHSGDVINIYWEDTRF